MAGLAILETALYVDDLDAATVFYRDVLGLSIDSSESGRHVFFRCGSAMLLIFNPEATMVNLGDVPPHGATGPGHVAFAIPDDDFQPWLDRLAKHSVALEAAIEWPSGGRSVYFRDPGGNSVELTTPAIWGIT